MPVTITPRQQFVQLDGVRIETALYTSNGNKLAVFLHPWSWLGGRMNDDVLQSLQPTFTGQGYHVLLFNSRGVDRSTGRASFSGLPEARDLQLLVQWALNELPGIKHVVLMGYSHGSLISSLHLPTIQDTSIQIHHILLSYPLSVRGFLTFFNTQKYIHALASLLSQNNTRTMIIYGTSDQFTSVSKYRGWVQGVTSEGVLTTHEVEGADHFWRGPYAEQLCTLIEAWLKELPN